VCCLSIDSQTVSWARQEEVEWGERESWRERDVERAWTYRLFEHDVTSCAVSVRHAAPDGR
jgi:hypothetical protein